MCTPAHFFAGVEASIDLREESRRAPSEVGIHYRGVQWEGGAVDGGSIIQ